MTKAVLQIALPAANRITIDTSQALGPERRPYATLGISARNRLDSSKMPGNRFAASPRTSRSNAFPWVVVGGREGLEHVSQRRAVTTARYQTASKSNSVLILNGLCQTTGARGRAPQPASAGPRRERPSGTANGVGGNGRADGNRMASFGRETAAWLRGCVAAANSQPVTSSRRGWCAM